MLTLTENTSDKIINRAQTITMAFQSRIKTDPMEIKAI